MAKKRTAEIEREIAEILSRIPRKTLKTRDELDKEIDAILENWTGSQKAERYEVAKAIGYRYPKKPTPKNPLMTPMNVSVLAELAHGRREFPNKVSAVSAPHLRRCMKAGAVKIVDGNRNRLEITPFGYESIMDYMATYPTLSTKLLAPTGPYSDDVHD